MLRRHLSARLDAAARDSGFTFVELLVAMFVIAGVLMGLMALQTSALVSTGQTRQRAQASAFANEVMEQLRALPWLTLSKGLHSAVASGTQDPNISGGRLRPTVGDAINEPLISSSSQAINVAPLSGVGGTNVTKDKDPASPGIVFTSRAYTTTSTSTADGVITLTVITTWKSSASGAARFIVLRSSAYAPSGGCGDASNQPYLGACQALLSGNGNVTGPTVVITSASTVDGHTVDAAHASILPDDTAVSASLSLASITSGVTSQQSTSVESSVTQASTSVTGPDTDATPTSGVKITNAASNDVGSSGAAPPNPPDVTSSGPVSTASVAGGRHLSLVLTAGSAVSGIARASTATSCWTGIPAGVPCSSSDTSGGGATTVDLGIDTAFSHLVSIAGGGTSKVFDGRFTSSAGATTVGCAILSGAGCVAAGSQRTVGTTTVGGLSWDSSAAPSGLLSVSGFSDSVRVERGLSQRTTAATNARSGTVTYWSSSGYHTLSLTPTTSTTIVTPEVSWAHGGTTVRATGTLLVTPAASTSANVDAVGCTGDGCSIDANTGSVSLSVTYTVTASGDTRSFTVQTLLGSAQANAAFKAAPNA